MSNKDQEDLRQHFLNLNLHVPTSFIFPTCDHPIEKWCSNCDYDYVTYEKIPHTRKYTQIYYLDE
jgi:hypothetical protein